MNYNRGCSAILTARTTTVLSEHLFSCPLQSAIGIVFNAESLCIGCGFRKA